MIAQIRRLAVDPRFVLLLALVVFFVLPLSVGAQTPEPSEFDVSAFSDLVTDGLTALLTAVVAIVTTLIAAAFGLMFVRKGIAWVRRMV